MIEVIKGIIDIMLSFINKIFTFKIDFVNGQEVELGIIVVSFVFIICVLYLILKTVGLAGGSDD